MQKLYFATLTPTCIASFTMADNAIRPEPERVDGKNLEAQEVRHDDASSVHSESSSIQAGVQKAMILKKAWSRTSLAIAFSRYVPSSFEMAPAKRSQSLPYNSRHHLLRLLWTGT